MKSRFVLIFPIQLFFSCFVLFAQTPQIDNSEISLFVPPVEGFGGENKDNDLLTEKITLELTARNYALAGNEKGSSYLLKGKIASWNENEREQNVPNEKGLYSFHLALFDSESKKELAEQVLLFSSVERIEDLLPLMITNIFSDAEAAIVSAWRDKRWYFGGALFWAPRFYYGSSASAAITNLGVGIFTEFHFLNFLSLETGLEAAPDWVTASGKSGDTYWDVIMSVPLLLKFVIKPGGNMMVEPYGGVNFNFPLYGAVEPPLLSWRLGLQYGIKAGPGVFFVEPKFSMDFGDSYIDTRESGRLNFKRYMLYIGAGYKFGIQRRPF